nr:hypothetical protein [Pantoea cypripedii]
MDREMALLRQIDDLKKNLEKTKSASNFILYSIVQVLDEQSGNTAFSDALREKITAELGKITMGGASIHKHAINELMQPPVRQLFTNQKPAPFIK